MEPAEVDVTDRRRTGRRPTRDNLATIEWAEGADFRETSARITDISQGGACFVAEVPPPVGRAVWLRLESPRPTGWISARVVRLEQSFQGGLSFSSFCPHNLIGSLA